MSFMTEKTTPAHSTLLRFPFTNPTVSHGLEPVHCLIDAQEKVFVSEFALNVAGDVIIESCDGVKFQTFRFLLSLSSPVFKDIFSIPQPTTINKAGDEAKDDLPVIPVTESADTLRTLLLLCYPGWMAKVNEDNVKVLADVLVAADKYEMEGIATQIEDLLLAPKLLECNALHVYAVACHYKLRKVAKIAAKYTLQIAVADWHYKTSLETVSAGMLQRLHAYRNRCIERVEANIQAQAKKNKLKVRCSWCGDLYIIQDVLAELRDCRWGGAVRETDMEHRKCSDYDPDIDESADYHGKVALAAEIRALVEKTVDEVAIDLEF